MFSADLVKRDIGDGELLRRVRQRLGPDELIELFTRKDSSHGRPFYNRYTAEDAIMAAIARPFTTRGTSLRHTFENRPSL